MQLEVSSIQFTNSEDFIRGYNTSVSFNFTLTNLETELRVDSAISGNVNYVITVTTAVPGGSGTPKIQSSSFTNAELRRAIDYAGSTVISGQVRDHVTPIITCYKSSAIVTRICVYLLSVYFRQLH